MASIIRSSLVHPRARASHPHVRLSQPPATSSVAGNSLSSFPKLGELSVSPSGHRNRLPPVKASPENNADNPEDGVSLGTMKLPANVDVQRFETLLFQWGNSLFQGANLPLPVPLKVDKIAGGARLGFITIEDEGKTDVAVYIDCLVFPQSESSGPVFRAIRNGRTRDKPAPGEERIMRSLLQALQKSVQIATL